jgi:hypothetical protein
MGFRELTERVIGKIKLTNHKRNEKFGSNPVGRRRIYIQAKDGIYNIPLFHHSIILPPGGMRQDDQASVNIYNFPALAG